MACNNQFCSKQAALLQNLERKIYASAGYAKKRLPLMQSERPDIVGKAIAWIFIAGLIVSSWKWR